MLRVLLDENNDLPPGGPRLVGGEQSAAVALRAVFSVQAGEWPYDFRFGMLWRQAVFGKFFNAATTSQMVAAAANTVPDITPVVDSQITIDTTTQAEWRQANITVEDISLRSDTEPVPGQFSFSISTAF
jgi:hypothetical protein